MSRKPKKTKLTVQYEPLEGEFFDVKPPEKAKWRVSDDQDLSEKRGFWSFFWMAFSVFLVLAVTGFYMNVRTMILENKSIAYAGFDSLKQGVSELTNQNFGQAEKLFGNAELAFQDLSDNLRFLTNQADTYFNTNLYIDAAEKLIESGVTVSKMGQQLTAVIDGVRDIPQLFIQQNTEGGENFSLTDLLKTQKGSLEEVLIEALLLQRNLATLNAGALPDKLSQEIAKGQSRIADFLVALKEIDQNFKTVLTLLGDEVPHRYLVLLQNNHELRATGGFIGSYMIVDVNDGVITKLEAKDIYETDGQLADFVAAPPGINQVAERLYMRDANYSPDFPTSARQLMWFLEHSRGPSVDTVIAVDQTIAEKLLELTGPVRLENFPFLIRADNFNDLFSFHIESKLSKTATPKQLLIDFIPVFKEKLFSLGNFSYALDLVTDLATSRHIQIYSTDDQIQALAQRFNLDGAMIASAPDVDYLAVVTTAIGGNKSDAFVETDLNHHSEIAQDGTIVDHLTIRKTHTWQEDDFAYWEKLISRYGTGKLHEKTLRFIQGEGDNVDYMRVYVPKGSRLIGLEGLELENLEAFEDLGYTVFAFNFGPLPAGESQSIELSYKLPHKLTFEPGDVYRFITQKQAGAENITLTKSLEASDYLQIVQTYPVTPSSAFTLYPTYETALDSNQIFLSAVAVK